MKLLIYCLSYLVLTTLLGCSAIGSQDKREVLSLSEEFNEYWYAGEAELTRYELQQARYGEIHNGEAVLIFVTEDFLRNKQVKYEGREYDDEIVSIMKLNLTRKFFTGIYPYSLMSSIFTPVDPRLPTLKISTSSQEWCGHTFTQLNYRNKKYDGLLYSYFQGEGDRKHTVDAVLPEDAIWTKIRLDPSFLPTGKTKLIPGTQFLRFRHMELSAQKAETFLTEFQDTTLSSEDLMKYRIEYQDIERVLEITFEKDFPHRILAWQEETPSGFGNPKILVTKALRTHTLKSPYWRQHSAADSVVRKELGVRGY